MGGARGSAWHRREAVRRPRWVAVREVPDAIRPPVRTGCAWATLPTHFPPSRISCWWSRRLTVRAVHDAVSLTDRALANRDIEPTAANIPGSAGARAVLGALDGGWPWVGQLIAVAPTPASRPAATGRSSPAKRLRTSTCCTSPVRPRACRASWAGRSADAIRGRRRSVGDGRRRAASLAGDGPEGRCRPLTGARGAAVGHAGGRGRCQGRIATSSTATTPWRGA